MRGSDRCGTLARHARIGRLPFSRHRTNEGLRPHAVLLSRQWRGPQIHRAEGGVHSPPSARLPARARRSRQAHGVRRDDVARVYTIESRWCRAPRVIASCSSSISSRRCWKGTARHHRVRRSLPARLEGHRIRRRPRYPGHRLLSLALSRGLHPFGGKVFGKTAVSVAEDWAKRYVKTLYNQFHRTWSRARTSSRSCRLGR